jgi:hypothetical protein
VLTIRPGDQLKQVIGMGEFTQVILEVIVDSRMDLLSMVGRLTVGISKMVVDNVSTEVLTTWRPPVPV